MTVVFRYVGLLFLTVSIVVPLTSAQAQMSTYIVTPPHGLPNRLVDKATGQHYTVSPDGKSVLCTAGDTVIWEQNLLSPDAELRVYLPSGQLYAVKENRIIGLSLDQSKHTLAVAIPGKGNSCWTTLDTQTGREVSGGCD